MTLREKHDSRRSERLCAALAYGCRDLVATSTGDERWLALCKFSTRPNAAQSGPERPSEGLTRRHAGDLGSGSDRVRAAMASDSERDLDLSANDPFRYGNPGCFR